MEEADLIASQEAASNDYLEVAECPECALPVDRLFHVLKTHYANLAIECRHMGMHKEADLFYGVEQDYKELEVEFQITMASLLSESQFEHQYHVYRGATQLAGQKRRR